MSSRRVARSKSSGQQSPTPMAGLFLSADPLSNLSPTAVRILKAARRLVVKRGYSALSLQSVAKEAGVLKSTIAYQFGDKAGLVTALVEWLIHDANVGIISSLDATPPGSERVHMFLKAQRETVEASAYWRLFFALLPEIIKDKKLRARFDDLMTWYHEVVLRSLGVWEEGQETKEGSVLASLVLAVLEGFALQRELFPGRSDLDAQYALWESIITPHVNRLLAEAKVADSGA